MGYLVRELGRNDVISVSYNYLLRGVCRPPSDIGVEYPPSPRCLALAHSSAIRLQSLGSACTGGLGVVEEGLGLLWTIGVRELGWRKTPSWTGAWEAP